MKCISEGTPIPVYGDGEQIREWIHADDNAKAIYNLMKSKIIGETFNIGSEYTITNNELINLVSEACGKPVNFEYIEDRLGHDRRYSLNSRKYQTIFGSPVTINLKDWLNKQLS